MSPKRPAAGGESCKQDSLFLDAMGSWRSCAPLLKIMRNYIEKKILKENSAKMKLTPS